MEKDEKKDSRIFSDNNRDRMCGYSSFDYFNTKGGNVSGEELINPPIFAEGSFVCRNLRAIRENFKEKFELEYSMNECDHYGPCLGTCPACDKEAEDLVGLALKKGNNLSFNGSEVIVKKEDFFQKTGLTFEDNPLDGMTRQMSKSEYGYPEGIEPPEGLSADFIFIDRLRIGIDGDGINTLVGFMGCPLDCKYCVNKGCSDTDVARARLTPGELYDLVKVDSLYFYMTAGGGITFGGGEPLMHPDFIKEFKKIVPESWCIRVETSLNVPYEFVESLLGTVDEWIVDVKDINNEIYENYTGDDNSLMLGNLMLLYRECVNVRLRVPEIPGYNTEEDIERSIKWLSGYFDEDKIERFRYDTRI